MRLLHSPGLRNTLLWLCLVLPWLNPFTSPPSTSVLPLLVSWMLSACALLLLADGPVLIRRNTSHGANATGATEATQASQPHALHIFALVCMAVVASVLGVTPVIDVGATAGLLGACVCVLTMVWVGQRMAWQPTQLLPWLAGAWLFAAALSSVLGVLQYLDWARGLSPWVNQPAFAGDAFANLRQRNQFASLTSIGLVALLAATHALRFSMQRHTPLLAFGLLNLLAMGAACSMSRTAVLQWCVVSVLALLWAWRHASVPGAALPANQPMHMAAGTSSAWWVLVISAPVLLLLWSFAMPLLSQHITGQAGANLALRVAGASGGYAACGSRSVLWANVLQLIAQKPLLGWGWGETDLAHFITPYPGPRFCDILDNAHNLPLHLALELGVPLAMCLLGLAVWWVWQRRPWQEQHIWRVMAWGVLLVVLMHGLLEYPLWYGPFQMAVGVSVGVLWTLPSSGAGQASQELLKEHATTAPATHRAQHEAKHVGKQEAQALCWASLFFLACLYAAWDFNRVAQIYKPVEQRDPHYSGNPLAHAKQSWLFANQAAFAELTLQQVNASNARAVYEQAQHLVHYSPEARVVQRLIDSARLLGHDDEANFWAERLSAHQRTLQR